MTIARPPLSLLLILIGLFVMALPGTAQDPFSTAQVKSGHPRLFASNADFIALRNPQSEELEQLMDLLYQKGEEMLTLEPVSRTLVGYRLLAQSRLALKRISTWALLYNVYEEERFLLRAKEELQAAIDFTDWNPRHYLDVGEMALAVSIGLDWLWDDLRPDFRQAALEAIRTKGILPSLDEQHRHNWWLHDGNNWNPVCNSGLIAGSLMLAHTEPELAEQVINRAIRILPNALSATDPDGVYLEGPSYWEYGTAFTVLVMELLEKATGSTFGLADHPSFLDSLDFRVMSVAPSGDFYNFYDSGETVQLSPTLSWFANYYDSPLAQFEAERLIKQFLDQPDFNADDYEYRLLPFQALWFPKNFGQTDTLHQQLPNQWFGGGPNAISIVRSDWNDPNAFYLAYKGGNGQISHAHQDAGSFIFEDEGVRWAVDLGAQNYNSLESLGLRIWDRRQHSDRWRVFRMGSYSHNILLIDERPQSVEGVAKLSVNSSDPNRIIGEIDLSEIYQEHCTSYKREIIAHDFEVVRINDHLVGARSNVGRQGRSAATLHWRMVTHANVEVSGDTATLSQNGKQLHVKVLSPNGAKLRVADLENIPTFWDAPNPNTRALDLWIRARDYGSETISILMSTDKEALEKIAAQES